MQSQTLSGASKPFIQRDLQSQVYAWTDLVKFESDFGAVQVDAQLRGLFILEIWDWRARGRVGVGVNSEGTPRNSVLLRDVAYIVEASPLVFGTNGDNTPAKYIAMVPRRVAKGQCYHRPALGCREFAANFSPISEGDRPQSINADLGIRSTSLCCSPAYAYACANA